MADTFVNLHVHDAFGSLLDSTLMPEDIAQFAHEKGQKAIATTNHGYMSSFVDVTKRCQKHGVKHIIGCEVYVVDDQSHKSDTKDYKQPKYHLVLLAKTQDGLKNLFQIVSNACIEGFYKKPRTSLDLIQSNGWGRGIICLTACQAGYVSKMLMNANETAAYEFYTQCTGIFDNTFIEVQSHSTQDQKSANQNLKDFIQKYDLPYVITTDAHMLSAEDREAHSIFVQISENREVGEIYTDCYLQTSDDVHRILDNQLGVKFVSKGISTTSDIADMIDEIDIGLGSDAIMPEVVADGYDNHEEYLRELVYSNFEAKFGCMSEAEKQIRRDRIDMELPVLFALKYTDYFIMLYMLAKEADNRGIPRGYSRGSGANCLCLFLLNVTQIDSIRWDLDFTRFANLGRKSVADYDWDISKRRRKEMVTISEDLFGKDHVAPIATFNTLSTKVALRDIGKVLNENTSSPYFGQIPYETRNEITKLIPTIKTINDLGEEEDKDVLLKELIGKNQRLTELYEEYPLWFKYVMALEGLPKSMGRHAAGTLITPKPVIWYCPLCCDKEGNQICQLEMHSAMDDLGLTKMDYLGLETLDTIDDALKMSNLTWEDVDINHLDLCDKAVYQNVYKTGNTIGIFQMESLEGRRMCAEAETDNIEDIIVVNAANRPGTKDSFPVYCKNKLHPEQAVVLHNDLKSIFAKTQYILLYQEQALAMFRYAGFPETEVDNARRAIGKKKADVMAALGEKFKIGLANKGWVDSQIEEMWQLILKQASYSFNRGHAVAYGLLSYLTAYLKTHYPVQFMTACLIAKESDTGKIGTFINECNRMHIQVLPPNVNKSEATFSPDAEHNAILFGVGAIKGMQSEIAQNIIANRPYTNFNDFLGRANNGARIGDKVIVLLVKAGAFKMVSKREFLYRYATMSFNSSYKEAVFKELASLPTLKKLREEFGIDVDAVKDKNERLRLYNNKRREIFNSQKIERLTAKEIALQSFCKEFADKYMQNEHMWEFETLSMFLMDDPIKESYKYINKYWDEAEDGDQVVIPSVIIDIQKKKDRRGKQFAYLHLYTPHGVMECVCWASQYGQYANLITKGNDISVLAIRKNGTFEIKAIKPYQKWLADRKITLCGKV